MNTGVMHQMPDFVHVADLLRVEVRFKNARLYDAIIEYDLPALPRKSAAGDASSARRRVKWFCDFHAICPSSVYGLINLKRSPFTRMLEMTDLPQRLCALLEKSPAWLFPATLYEQTWRPMVHYLSEDRVECMRKGLRLRLDHACRASLTEASAAPDVVGLATNAELATQIACSVGTLRPNERQVLTERFGLDGNGEHTLEEVAAHLHVSSQRVRQIEAKALRKMRHPSRSRRLRAWREWNE